ncbi:MAG: 6-hydroxymethylpterin diphosphokinase MptE-like protein [Planctomycetota bacterium]
MLGDGGLFPEGWDTSRDLLVVIGRGADALLEQLAAQGQRRVFVYLPEEASGTRVPQAARLVHSPMDLFDGVLALRRPLPKRVVVQRQPDPWVSDEVHGEVSRTVEESLRARRLRVAKLDRHGPGWLAQAMEALPEVARHGSVAALDGAFAKRPCFIASPGPSLEKNAALLRDVKGRAVIAASTHALAPLQAQGVVPDLVLAAGPEERLLRHYSGVDLSGVEALLVGATCHRGHWEQGARRHLSFANGDQLDDWIHRPYREDARLASGGSVACSAVSLALRMGCDPIVFLGQDLAFDGDRYYSPSSVDAEARIEPSEDGHSFRLLDPARGGEAEPQQMVKVMGYKGGLVLTSETFRSYLVWLETLARSREGRTMFINCTEGGANIRGMQHRPLADVVPAYVRADVAVGDVLDQRLAGLDLGERRRQTIASAELILGGIEPCLELAARCRVLAGEARSDAGRLDALQDAERELTTALRSARFLSMLAPREILAAQERVQAARTLEQNLAAAQDLFELVERSGGTLHGPLAAALAELR